MEDNGSTSLETRLEPRCDRPIDKQSAKEPADASAVALGRTDCDEQQRSDECNSNRPLIVIHLMTMTVILLVASRGKGLQSDECKSCE
jgi:hypothetical protein